MANGDPSHCANNCGFFGNPSTNNLCSKCYKDCLMKQSKDLSDSVLNINKLGDQKLCQKKDELGVNENIGEGSSTSSGSSEPGTRCSLCKKRVGLTGFRCRCGQTFCSLHRYSDKHNCVFDYKGAGKEAIARANPVVKADKIHKI